MNEAQETFMRAHFARQRDLHARSLQASSQLAQVNTELILRNGLSQLGLRRMKEIVGEEQVQQIKELVGMVVHGEADHSATAQ